MNNSLISLYHQYFERIYRYVFFRVGSVADAEDIVSDIFEKIIQYYPSFIPEHTHSEVGWVFSIVRSQVAEFYRRSKPTVELSEEIPSHLSVDFKHIDINLDVQRVYAAIHHLAPRQQEILLLRYQSDLTNKEIAHMLDIDAKTVSGILSKGLTQLKHYLHLSV